MSRVWNYYAGQGPRASVLDTAADPNALYRVATADGTPLCVVLPGPDYREFEQRMAMRPRQAMKRD